jgi:hypothetical protein
MLAKMGKRLSPDSLVGQLAVLKIFKWWWWAKLYTVTNHTGMGTFNMLWQWTSTLAAASYARRGLGIGRQ